MQTFFVPGPLPGMNEIIAAAKSGHGRGNAYSRLKKYWTTIIVLAIRQARIVPVERVEIEFVWSEPNQRRDPDNFTSGGRKLILDSLIEAGVLENDGWKQITGFEDSWGKNDKPGVMVFLYDLDSHILDL